ncbi:UNVERIFIED_CONTAM: hypothetical protein K2H54_032641 [Gekko kuhli]
MRCGGRERPPKDGRQQESTPPKCQLPPQPLCPPPPALRGGFFAATTPAAPSPAGRGGQGGALPPGAERKRLQCLQRVGFPLPPQHGSSTPGSSLYQVRPPSLWPGCPPPRKGEEKQRLLPGEKGHALFRNGTGKGGGTSPPLPPMETASGGRKKWGGGRRYCCG